MYYQPKHPLAEAIESIFWKLMIIGVVASALWFSFGKSYVEFDTAYQNCMTLNTYEGMCDYMSREEVLQRYAPAAQQ